VSTRPEPDHSGARKRARTSGETARLALAAVVLIVAVVFALANTDDTNVDYLFGDTDAPLIVVMVLSAVAGAVVAVLVAWRRR
jgi:uncharacterized integral membrane protein